MSNEIYFTADLHLGHSSIIRHCNRPFATIEEHDEALIKNWNSVVSKRGLTYILGDFALPRKIEGVDSMKMYRHYFHALNGRKILIKGNHDHMSRDMYSLFTEVRDVMEPKIDSEKIFLFHYPCQSWNASCHGRLHLYAHVHNRSIEHVSRLSFDIGVDTHNYFPYTLDEIKAKTKIKRQEWEEYWASRKMESNED